MRNKGKTIRYALILLCELFTVGNIIMLFSDKQFSKLLLAFTTILLILLPELAERLLRCRISQPLYLFCLFYAIGPMLGHCNNLYHLIPWWDKMLHIMGGIIFALIGMYFYSQFGGDNKNRLLSCCFAICFSMAVSVLWEFFEFGMDQLFAFDMQDDSIIRSITSYTLGSSIGKTGTLSGITAVTVDGRLLPFSGYLDIGLIDTMLDMLLETIGAVITAVWVGIDNGKRMPIRTSQMKQ